MTRRATRTESAPAAPGVLHGAVRVLAVCQALGGTVMIGRPAPLARAVSSAPSSVPALWLLRLLGLRLLVQGITGAVWPRREVAAISAGVDVTHSVTMVLAAVVKPRFRRPALISGAASLASAALSAPAAASSTGRTR